MIYTKLSVLLAVLCTALSGLLDGSVPYFPIEISRTAAGPLGRIVFPLGTALSFAVSLYELRTLHAPFLGLFILALVDDHTSWAIHMFGVFLMIVSIGWDAWRFGKLWPFLLICCIYLGRLVLKMGVTYHYGLFKPAAKASLQIMYTGKAETPAQLLVFKLGGVLQWVFLYGIMELYSIGKN